MMQPKFFYFICFVSILFLAIVSICCSAVVALYLKNTWKSRMSLNLQGCKEEKYPSGVNSPARRRTPESESLATEFTFGRHRCAAHAAICDGDLMMDLGIDGVIGGPHCHYHWLFRRVAAMESSCSFHTKAKLQNIHIKRVTGQQAPKFP